MDAQPAASSHSVQLIEPSQQQVANSYTREQHEQLQSNAMVAAALIFLSGGMKIAWSLGFCSDRDQDSTMKYLQLHISWFLAALAGALFSSCLSRPNNYKHLMSFSSLLVLLGGLCCIRYSPVLMQLSLYLDGLANGLVFAPTISLLGELALPESRGCLASSVEQMCYTLGSCMQLVFSICGRYPNDFMADQLHGLVSVICGSLALHMATRHSLETHDQRLMMQHSSCHLDYDKKLNTAADLEQALPALWRLSLLRALQALSFSAVIVIMLNNVIIDAYRPCADRFVIYALLRLVGSGATACIVDCVGRKLPMLLGLCMCSLTAVGIASKLMSVEFMGVQDMKMLHWLLVTYQCFAAVCFASTSAYLTEAFPQSVKQHCIGCIFMLEQCIQLCFQAVIYALDWRIDLLIAFYFSAVAACMLLALEFCFNQLPETKRMKLQQAQSMFCSAADPPTTECAD